MSLSSAFLHRAAVCWGVLLSSLWAPWVFGAEPADEAVVPVQTVSVQQAVLPFPGGDFLPDAKTLAPGQFRMQVFASDRDILLKNGGRAGARQTVPLSPAENQKFSKEFGCYGLCAGELRVYKHFAPISNADDMVLGPDGSVYLAGSPPLSKIAAQDPKHILTLLPERILGYLRGANENTVEPVYAYQGQSPIVTAQGHVFMLGLHTLQQILGPNQIKRFALPLVNGKPPYFPPRSYSSQLRLNEFGCMQITTDLSRRCEGLECTHLGPQEFVRTCVDANGRVIEDYKKLPLQNSAQRRAAIHEALGFAFGFSILKDGTDEYIGPGGPARPAVLAPDNVHVYALMSLYKKNGKKIVGAESAPNSLYRFRVIKIQENSEGPDTVTITPPELMVKANGKYLHWKFDPKVPDHNFSRLAVARNGDIYLKANYTIYKLTPKP